jgi:alpha-galactosidase
LKALLGLGDLMTNVNMENRGQVANLPDRCVVETNALFSRDQVCPLSAGSLPAGLAALIQRHICNQEMIIEAALHQDKNLAFQAVFSDPSVHLPIDTSWDMFNELLHAGQEFLPGWVLD